jgi:hypothetical protein
MVAVIARASAREEMMLEACTEKRLPWVREEIMFLAFSSGSFVPTFLLTLTYFHHFCFLIIFYFSFFL